MAGSNNQQKASLFPIILIFGGVGLILLVIAFYIYTARQEFIGSAIGAEGEVIGFEKRATGVSSPSRSTYAYAPIVRFTDASGEQITFVASAAGGGSGLQKGDAVEVFYSPTDSQDAKISTAFHLWAAPIVVGALGAVFFGIGLLLTIVSVLERGQSQKRLRESAVGR